VSDTDSAQNALESENEETVKFPKKIKHRGKVLAKIYGKSKSYPFYRVSYYAAGTRRLLSFRTYSEAKTKADNLVKDLAKGSQVAALSAPQARDALAALREKYPAGTLATLRVADGPWRDLAPGSAELVAFVRPRDLAVA